jgi:ferric-dicitrate binding protein FerR (iron transport regulator)
LRQLEKQDIDQVEKEDLYKKIVESWEVPAGKSEEQAWQEVNKHIEHGKIVQMPRRTNYIYWLTAAAAVAIFAFFLLSPEPSVSMREVSTAMAQREHVILPDGSEADLNAGSKIRFATEWSSERVVELEGEAFFKVKKGSKFSVKTNHGQVDVLGTSFNVKDRTGIFDVECFTGKVGVSAGDARLEITPGEHVVLQGDKLQYSEFTGERTWLTGQFVYNDEPLENVILEVERQFNVKIQHPDFFGRKYTGAFNTKNLREALDVICIPMGYQYSIDENMNVLIEEKN